MKKNVFTAFLACLSICCSAQESQTAYNFLRLPVSAHIAAIGGDNITIDNDDPTVIFHNPALISNLSRKMINLNFMTYMEGAKTGSAAFIKPEGERATWGVAAQYMNYGSMKMRSINNEDMGDFSAKDIAVSGSFAYALTKHIAGGITARFITSFIGGYSSIAMGVDLGVNYYNPDIDLSVSLVARNLGGQIKAFDEEFDRIPFDLQLGGSYRFRNMPFRISATLTRLTDWNDKFLHHVVLGADVFLGENIWLGAGYNFRRSSEMKIDTGEGSSNRGAGFSFGGGIELERFQLQVAYSKLHVSANSLIISASYAL